MARRRAPPTIEQLVTFAVPEPSTRAIEIEFYSRLDETSFYTKAFALYHGLQNPDSLSAFFAADPAGLVKVDDSLTDALKAEIHRTELDLTECLFAFMIAAFQTTPHPVFMATYQRDLVRWAVDRYLAGDARALTSDAIGSRGEFIELALYANLVPSERGDEWARNIHNIAFLLETAGRRYLEGVEQRPLGRGLRIARDMSETARFVEGPEADAARAGIDDWLAVYRVKRRKDGHQNLYRVLKTVSLEETVNLIYLMTVLLRLLKQARLARLEGRTGMPIHSLAALDTEALGQLKQNVEIRTKIGIVVGSDIE